MYVPYLFWQGVSSRFRLVAGKEAPVLKGKLKKYLARLGGWSRRHGETPILMYHSVHPEHPLAVKPAVFRRQIAWLTAHYRVLPLSEYVELKRRDLLEAGMAAVTFDDGYRDNYWHAYPVLREFSCPATIFLATAFLEPTGAGRDQHDQAPATAGGLYPGLESLQWEEMRAMEDLVEPGAHTHTHIDLGSAPAREAQRELEMNCRLIRERLGRETSVLAYPWGQPRNLPSRGLDSLKTRFRGAVTTILGADNRPGRIDPYLLRRVGISPQDDQELFQARVRGQLDALRWLHARR